MQFSPEFKVGPYKVGLQHPTLFIADLAANHDGDLGKARALIWAAKYAGADAVKFQHFQASKIVSDLGFQKLGSSLAHQAKWKKSVYQVYEQFSIDRNWDDILTEEAAAAGIEWMTTPYDAEAVEAAAAKGNAIKVGSGDITWTDSLDHIASKDRPVFLATGASSEEDVVRAVECIVRRTPDICLMQCNTNYTGDLENFRFVNLNVLKRYAELFPGMILGLSDHTPGHATVLGAIALGARAVEKHFTFSTSDEGPDHAFSMTPATWREMVDRARELQAALGDGVKRVEPNEAQSAVVQRRCLRFVKDLGPGEVLSREHLEPLRPAPAGSLAPHRIVEVIGKTLRIARKRGEELLVDDLE